VPAALINTPQWLAWRGTPKANGKLDKEPVDPHTGGPASTTDSATWGTYEEAVAYAERHGLAGVGFVFTEYDEFMGVDLDDCRDVLTGKLDHGATDLVAKFGTYAEFSPSGTGVKMFMQGVKPGSASKNSTLGIEMYDQKRFFTVTGQQIEGTPSELAHPQELINRLYRETFGDRPSGEGVPEPGPGNDVPDHELRTLMFAARNGDAVCALWDGDTSRHGGDESRADMALMSHLAFWTAGDPKKMERMFSASALGEREKWMERTDYRERTINAALAHTTEYYAEVPLNGHKELPEGGLLALRQPVGAAVRDGVVMPPQLIDGLLYKAAMHSWHGEAGTGKSLLALYAAQKVMEDSGRVLYLDEEGSLRMVSERLGGLGAEPAMLDDLFYYLPVAGLTPEHAGGLVEVVEAINPALVVFDSWIDHLSIAGLDENSSTDVTGWVKALAQPLKDQDAAVLLLDHDNKDGKGRGGGGSTAKLAKLDASYKVTVKEPFDRNRVGRVQLIRDKDREGALEHLHSFAIGGDGAGRVIVEPGAGLMDVRADGELTTRQKEALSALVDSMGFTEWYEASGISSRQTVSNARKALMNRGLVEQHGNLYRRALQDAI
jgi:putative DNA primase/helicase